MSERLWIKQPLACFDGTRQIETNGLVIETVGSLSFS